MKRNLRNSVVFFALGASLAGVGGANADPVTAERLLNAGSEAENANWMMANRTFDGHRFSPLDEITPENVSGLRLAYAAPIGGMDGNPPVQTQPLVVDGMMYIDQPRGTPAKFDVSSGTAAEHIWTCDTGLEIDLAGNTPTPSRGLALLDGLVVTAMVDGRVVACDDDSGEVVWETQVTQDPSEGFTNAPLAVGDKIIVGQSLGDWVTRGWTAALDAETGEELWRFYTVPAPGEPGSETWLCEEGDNPNCWETGGAALWGTAVYDPEQNVVIWGTGNPVPMFDPETRPGDNLYSNSSIAIDVDTGELKWYFQYTPGDYLDYDEVGSQLLVDVEIDGEMRKTLAHFGRNGFFYTLDRTNGAFISAAQYVDELDWTEGIDPKTGMPIGYDPEALLQEYKTGGAPRRGGGPIDHCPHIQGGVNFFPTAYNPILDVAYGAGIEGCSAVETEDEVPDPAAFAPGETWLGGTFSPVGNATGSIAGFSVSSGQQAAKVDLPHANYAGVLATPGLVFTGQVDGKFEAFDAETLEKVWSISLGTPFEAPPMSFSVDGKQYVAIIGGPGGNSRGFTGPMFNPAGTAAMLYVFAL